jgi:hypothetical protein
MAKLAFEAHPLGDTEARDDALLDLLARLASRLAGPPILPPRLVEVGDKSITPDGC